MSNQPVPMSSSDNAANRDNVIRDILEKLRAFANNVLTLEVTTYISYPEAISDVEFPVGNKPYKAVLQCYTQIKFDQDAVLVLPVQKIGDEVKLNEGIYKLHKEQVDSAIRARTEMVKAALDGLARLLPG